MESTAISNNPQTTFIPKETEIDQLIAGCTQRVATFPTGSERNRCKMRRNLAA